jgi:hypothetical protein
VTKRKPRRGTGASWDWNCSTCGPASPRHLQE